LEGFKDQIDKEAFIEWEEVYTNNFYGTLKSEIERIWANGKSVIFDVDVIGGLNLKRIFGEQALSVFVKPPSYEVLEKRLRNRSTETEDKIQQRMKKANEEFAYAPEFDIILINDNLDEACKTAKEMVSEFLSIE
jgi:guanylate kinase